MITQEQLKETLSYDPQTGLFTRVVRIGRYKAGEIAGTVDKGNGYVRIYMRGKNYHAHRLAYFYMVGEWPPHVIDHKDGNPSNNKWINLRPCTMKQNQANMRGHRKKFLPKNVHNGRNNKYRVVFTVDGKTKQIGTFNKLSDAVAARNTHVVKLHGEFAR